MVSWSDRHPDIMPRHAPSNPPTLPRKGQPLGATWKLEDAKARFSEVVRLARSEGPQRVTVRGKDAVVVISTDALEKLLPPETPRQNLVEFLRGFDLTGIDLTRERDTGRDIAL
jgi:antitoxin Phd